MAVTLRMVRPHAICSYTGIAHKQNKNIELLQIAVCILLHICIA